MRKIWGIANNSWSTTTISNKHRVICTLNLEESFDVTEDNQDWCEAQQARDAKLIAAAPELANMVEDLIAIFSTFENKEDNHCPSAAQKILEAQTLLEDLL